ncbi:hypothetical protein [Streptomyces sp. M41(2017)]|uniref:hypothetical protein n=1 Tax=Streptomyces sp. M41(2017) TaxID=1955065 RepID=UPI00117DBED1|nr:hypothetical protein [Streptomyces sp. M41(2017)]
MTAWRPAPGETCLAGWPEGPTFTVLSKSVRRARSVRAFGVRLAAVVVLVGVEVLTGLTEPTSP